VGQRECAHQRAFNFDLAAQIGVAQSDLRQLHAVEYISRHAQHQSCPAQLVPRRWSGHDALEELGHHSAESLRVLLEGHALLTSLQPMGSSQANSDAGAG
jgi:hypothetical protein